jgi:hypothetical protein
MLDKHHLKLLFYQTHPNIMVMEVTVCVCGGAHACVCVCVCVCVYFVTPQMEEAALRYGEVALKIFDKQPQTANKR